MNEKWENFDSDEDEEEALSLCDLPTGLKFDEKTDVQSRKEVQSIDTEEEDDEEEDKDFDFRSCGGSVLAEPEMCAADEVFFQGQILPLRLSISSDSGLPPFRLDSRNPSGCTSRSESMDHVYSGRFSTVFSSRSNSSSSHNSSTSASSVTMPTTSYKYEPKIRNQFHTHPSPKPQIHTLNTRPVHANTRVRKSTTLGLFRVGLVRTPEIGLDDLKLRSSNSSTSSNSGVKNSVDEKKKKNKKKTTRKSFSNNGGLFSGCKCSADAVGTDPWPIFVIKSRSGDSKTSENVASLHAKDGRQEQKRQRKHAMSRHRTFEWLKELSIVGATD